MRFELAAATEPRPRFDAGGRLQRSKSSNPFPRVRASMAERTRGCAMAEQTEVEFFASKGFGQTMGFGDTPVLIVVDFLKAFTDPTMMLGAKLDDEIAATNKLLAAAHLRNVPVFFSIASYDDEDLKDAGIWTLKQKGSVTLRAGSDGVRARFAAGFPERRQSAYKEICLMFFRDRSCPAPEYLPYRHTHHRRLHHQRLRARHGSRCLAEWLPADDRA